MLNLKSSIVKSLLSTLPARFRSLSLQTGLFGARKTLIVETLLSTTLPLLVRLRRIPEIRAHGWVFYSFASFIVARGIERVLKVWIDWYPAAARNAATHRTQFEQRADSSKTATSARDLTAGHVAIIHFKVSD